MIILADAAIYACIIIVCCIGLSITYKVTGVPNFAHASFVILGMYMALVTTKVMGGVPYMAIPLAFIISGATALFLYVVIIRTLQKKRSSYLVLIIATLAFDIFMIGVLNIIADTVQHGYGITARDFTLRSFDYVIFGAPAILVISIIAVASIACALYWLLYHTKFGVAMRASIENADLAQVFGINTQRIFSISWFLSGGLGGIAGVLMSVWFQGDPSLAAIILPTIFAGSIVGGFGSIWGAILGGAIIGVSEILGTNLLAQHLGYWIIPYRLLIPFAFIIVTLVVAPKGAVHLLYKLGERLRV